MHVHAGFGDPDSRIRVMTALRRYLPLLNALSGSSPFYDARESGFKCGRLNLFEAMPRTSIPGSLHPRASPFPGGIRCACGCVPAPGLHRRRQRDLVGYPAFKTYPTVELRICDVCPRIEDALCIAAMCACLIRMLLPLERADALPAEPPTEIIAENKWLAQRYRPIQKSRVVSTGIGTASIEGSGSTRRGVPTTPRHAADGPTMSGECRGGVPIRSFPPDGCARASGCRGGPSGAPRALGNGPLRAVRRPGWRRGRPAGVRRSGDWPGGCT